MNKKALSLAVCLAMALPTASRALSLGDIESDSSLNQPFRGTIKLLSTSLAEASSLRVRVAPPAVFNRVGIDRPAFLNNIRFRTTVKDGKPVILVTSSQPIKEPFLNFLLEVSWPNGQLLKEYTVLLDPPVLIQPDTAIASNTVGVREEPGNQVYSPAITPVQAQRQQPKRVVRNVASQSGLRRPGPPRRASASASRVRTYRVRSGDTLYKVARKLGYKGVRNEQMVMALYNKNKHAFSRRNMNLLKAGARLARPSYQEARSISSRKAKAQILAQAREWKQWRAGAVAKSAAKRKHQVAANTARKPAHVEVMGSNQSVDAIKTPGSGGSSATVRELKKQLAQTREALTAREKENEDLKSRISELESLLRKKNKLITLKSEQLARLQEKMGKAGVAGSTASEIDALGDNSENGVATEPVASTSIDDEGTDINRQVADEQSKHRGEILRNEQDQQAIVSDTATASQDVSDNEPSPFKQDNVDEGDSLDIMGLLGSPAAMGIGGGTLLALLGGLWFMRRRKQGEDGYQEPIDFDLDDHSSDVTFDDSSVETGLDSESTPFDDHEFDDSDTIINKESHPHKEDITKGNEQEDILQEADVYIVYGLHDQAESELKRAIDNDPKNLAYRAKLLENYKAAGNKEAFEAEAKAFMDLDVDGKDAYLDDITEWGKALLPESKLFGSEGLKAAGAAGVAMVAGTALANSGDDATENKGQISQDGADLSEVDVDDSSLEDLNIDDLLSEDTDDIDDLASLNDDLDIDIKDLEELDDLDDEVDLDDLDDLDLDIADEFNFDLNEDNKDKKSAEAKEPESSSEELDLEMASTEKLLESAKKENADNINFLDLDEAEESDSEKPDEANLDLANLNLNLDSEDFEKIMPKDNAYKKQEVENPEEDNLLADFDDNISFLDLDNDSEVIEETQIDTKLDLARAYIDMGDIEGARSTLEEVLQEGSDEQKREAENLLHQTG